MKHLLRLITLSFVLCFALPGISHARDYITQQQLDQATVVDLPGRIGADVARERDPENMAVNAISKVGGLLSNYTGLTLGMVGGIATLGFLGVLSAPVAIIGAAAVGGLALVGGMTENSRRMPRGLSTENYGHMGFGSPGVYGARTHQEGIMGNVFGWSDSRTSRYNIGSIGVSSSQRAPVHVNMQSPHVLNVTGRGYDFMNYDSGYTNINPTNPTHPGMAISPVAGRAVPFSPGSSNKPASASNSPSSPYMGYPGGMGNPMGYQGGMGSPYMTNMNYGYPQQVSGSHYDRRQGEGFNNFFQRIDNPGVQSGQPGTRGEVPNRRNYFYQGPSPYSYNWQQTRNAPKNYLSQSWEYQQSGQWNSNSPQGRVARPNWNNYQPGTPIPTMTGQNPGGSAAGSTQIGGPTYQTSAAGSGSPLGSVPVDPMNFRFGAPNQAMDYGVPQQYPMGNAYNNPALPNTYDRNFATQQPYMNQGYQPNMIVPNGGGYNQYGMPGIPVVSGQGAMQIRDEMGYTPQAGVGTLIPVEKNAARTAVINENANSTASEQQAVVEQSVAERDTANTHSILNGAMAPESSKFSHEKLAELEDARQAVYKKLLEAMKLGQEDKQAEYFKKYQELTSQLNAMQK